MKAHYYPETDSVYIDLQDRPSVDSREIAPGVVADFDEAGDLVGLDVDRSLRNRYATPAVLLRFITEQIQAIEGERGPILDRDRPTAFLAVLHEFRSRLESLVESEPHLQAPSDRSR